MPENKFKLLIYGADAVDLPFSEKLEGNGWRAEFAELLDSKRFNDYDGVIVFQGACESLSVTNGYYGSQIHHTVNHDDLDRRKKEIALLEKKGGFVCCLLWRAFRDTEDGDYSNSDIVKWCLSYNSLYRTDIPRNTQLTSHLSDFDIFISTYGAASSRFEHHGKALPIRPLAKAGESNVGLLLDEICFVVPTLLPEKTSNRMKEYFELLCESLISSRQKLVGTTPEWANAFRFPEEEVLLRKQSDLMKEKNSIESRLATFTRYKSILSFSGDRLVDEVAAILQEGLGLEIQRDERFREDLSIVSDGKIAAIVEVKGSNGGVKREHINQVDSHRERNELPSNFPGVLIFNGHIKTSHDLDSKRHQIAREQIDHAEKSNVLVLRTIDLLELVADVQRGGIDSSKVKKILTTKTGILGAGQNEVSQRINLQAEK